MQFCNRLEQAVTTPPQHTVAPQPEVQPPEQAPQNLIWVDGQLLTHEAAGANPLANGLHYGSGVFEGIRAYPTHRGPAIFRLREHLERMDRGAKLLHLDFDLDTIFSGCIETLRASRLESAYIRPLTYFNAGGLGLDVGALTTRSLIAAIPWSNHLKTDDFDGGISLTVTSWRRNRNDSLPPLKMCGGYVNSLLAKREAVEAGFDEALFVDDLGFVCEASAANVFMVKNNRVVAIAHPDALPGITRQSVIEFADAAVRKVTLEELRTADEIFVTGTSAELTPVKQFEGRTLGVGPITKALEARFDAIVHGRGEFDHWLTYINDAAQTESL